MKDRIPTYPGRVQLTNVGGDIYDLTRADEPTEVGTPLSKATLLDDDAVTALIGAGLTITDETPSEAFEQIAGVIGSNLVRPKIELLTYTGTGTYGSSNPTEITFSFDPDIIMVTNTTPLSTEANDFLSQRSYSTHAVIPVAAIPSTYTSGFGLYHNASATNYGKYDTATHKYSFYLSGSGAAADKQLNASGKTYYVLAIKGAF